MQRFLSPPKTICGGSSNSTNKQYYKLIYLSCVLLQQDVQSLITVSVDDYYFSSVYFAMPRKPSIKWHKIIRYANINID